MAVDWDDLGLQRPKEEEREVVTLEDAAQLLDEWIRSHRRLEVALAHMEWDRDYYRDLARFTEAARVAEKSAPV